MLEKLGSDETAKLETVDTAPGLHWLLQVMPQDVLQGVA